MINKEKILAGVRACITPNLAICQDCPYWNNGQRQCEELRMDIVEAIDTGIFAPQTIPKIAKWIPITQINRKYGVEVIVDYECSLCSNRQEVVTNYCSHCGARAKLEDK
jgi:hypothetical protein